VRALRTARPGLSAEAPGHGFDVGSVIGSRYKLVEWLGAGGMGEIFKAVDRLAHWQDDPDPYVAIKILKGELQQDRAALKALQREANRALRLTHPNIVRIRQLEQDQETGTYFIVMELLEGRTVQSIIAANRHGQSWQQIAPYVAQICAGLQYAHREGIIHCDIKPGNLFITRRGVVKILDFGIAVPVPGTTAGRETSVDSRKLGARTPEYASLEMFLGREAHYSDDVYSLACVVHEWLCGSLPYLSRRRRALSAPQALAIAARPARLAALTRAQNRALARALALSRARRTQTVGELWRSLSDVRRAWPRTWIAAGAAAVLLAGAALLSSVRMLPGRPLPVVPAVHPGEVGRGQPSAESGPLGAGRQLVGTSAATPSAQADTVPLDEVAATRWLMQEAQGGNALAQYYLGVMYQAGRGGLLRSDTSAAGWFALSAAQGNGAAQSILGYLYQSGQGVPRSDVDAVHWLIKAAQQGNASGQYNLAVMYENGRGGLPRSQTQAQRWLVLAALQGHAQAQIQLEALGVSW
jgi:TPR repeat protein